MCGCEAAIFFILFATSDAFIVTRSVSSLILFMLSMLSVNIAMFVWFVFVIEYSIALCIAISSDVIIGVLSEFLCVVNLFIVGM